jgi:hypothetical protein
MPRRAILFLFLGLAACGTPQERCIQRETRDLRVVDRLIAETEGNLKRGYALEEITIYHSRWVRCYEPAAEEGAPPRPTMCRDEVEEIVTRPKAINLEDEAAKLASLKRKRASLAREAQPAIAACKAQYPE